jgi:O-antigen/teichoic acid export membrane protein
VIHHLGDERYGIWALVFSLVDYYALVDFGFRSAVVKYVAHFRATGEMNRLETLISTGLAYFSLAAIAVAAQYNSSAILYGLAKHAALARAVLIEAILSVAGLWYALPRYGILSAAYIAAVLMIASRGIVVPYALSRYLEVAYGRYMWGIYGKALVIAAPVSIVTWLANHAMGEPARWTVVLGGGAAMAACYYALVLFHGVEPEHRAMALAWAKAGLRNLH